MDKSAIEQIQLGTVASVVNAALASKKTAEPVIVVPQAFDVRSLESYMPRRSRFVGEFITSNMDSFAAYAKKNKSKDAACFINAEDMSAKIIFDLGSQDDAGHCGHHGTIKADKQCDFSDLLNVVDTGVTQKQLAEFVESWADNITAVGKDGSEIDLGLAVAAIRNLTITSYQQTNHQQETMRSKRSSLEEVEAKGGDNLPVFISFNCQPYIHAETRDFMARVSVITSHDEPRFRLSILKYSLHQEELAEEFNSKVNAAIENTEIPVFVGSFRT